MKSTKKNKIENFSELSLERLIDYISSTRHIYLKEIILSFKAHLKAMLKIESDTHPEVLLISKKTEELNALLEKYLNMGEQILFPYLKGLSGKSQKSDPVGNSSENLVAKIKKEHVRISAIIQEIRKLSNNYTPGTNSSPALKLCYAQMFDLEQDIHRHIFIEEQILFPKMQECEKRMINNL